MSELREKLKSDLQEGIDQCKASGGVMFDKGWAMQEGVLITGHQAEDILSLFDRVKELENKDYNELKGIMRKLEELQQQNERLREEKKEWATKIIGVRDAIVGRDYEEAWHQLYQIANPNYDKLNDEVWKELEALKQ